MSVMGKHGISSATPSDILLVAGSGFDWPEPDHFRLVLLPEAQELKKAIEDIGDFLSTYHQ